MVVRQAFIKFVEPKPKRKASNKYLDTLLQWRGRRTNRALCKLHGTHSFIRSLVVCVCVSIYLSWKEEKKKKNTNFMLTQPALDGCVLSFALDQLQKSSNCTNSIWIHQCFQSVCVCVFAAAAFYFGWSSIMVRVHSRHAANALFMTMKILQHTIFSFHSLFVQHIIALFGWKLLNLLSCCCFSFFFSSFFYLKVQPAQAYTVIIWRAKLWLLWALKLFWDFMFFKRILIKD